ncbi:phosphate permease Pho89p [Diutina rugosa]
MALTQFNHIFAVTMIFAFLDAWNIGANDVANSFASSVSSRSLTYWQAMILAALCEFLGAVLVGSKVSNTIRNKIVDVKVFEGEPAILMLTMSCALIGSSVWLTIATAIGMPVSTTHSIVGGIIGSAIAAKGQRNIHWGWNGVSQIIASWFIAPAIAGAFATITFLVSKFFVLEVKSFKTSLRNAMVLVPFLVFSCFAILTMLIVWKGAPALKLNKLSPNAIAASILGVAAVALVLYMLFLYPYYRRKLKYNDWTLTWKSIPLGPLLYFKSTDDIPPMPEGYQLVPDYYKGRRYDETGKLIKEDNTTAESLRSGDIENLKDDTHVDVHKVESAPVSSDKESSSDEWKPLYYKWGVDREVQKEDTKSRWIKMLKKPKLWGALIVEFVLHGFTQDVIASQTNVDMLSGDQHKLHTSAKYYDNRIEFLYSLLQGITAGTMSFAHGANDISNATGPLATVYLVWSTNTIANDVDVPVWVLCYAAAALVIGVWTFGYRIMRNLGNKLILQSPSRGFSIELGAAVTTVMATQLSIPVSTTQSAVGATVFVGACNGDWRSINWRMVIWCYCGWFITLPVAGLIAGLLNAYIIHSPSNGVVYTMNN